jgi:hypothetical protein
MLDDMRFSYETSQAEISERIYARDQEKFYWDEEEPELALAYRRERALMTGGTYDAFWECACGVNGETDLSLFVHSKAETFCRRCGAQANESPDASINEMLIHGLIEVCRNVDCGPSCTACVRGFNTVQATA